MRRWALVVASLCLAAANPLAAKDKHKQKSFEPVPMTDPHGYAGRYVGVDGEFWADVTVGPGDRIDVSLHENGKLVVLRDLQLAGARLRGKRIDAAGNEQPFEATFGNRSVNYDVRFGLLVEGSVPTGDGTVLNRLFYRRAASGAVPR